MGEPDGGDAVEESVEDGEPEHVSLGPREQAADDLSYRPLDTILHAVRRRTRAGRPIGLDQALTVEEAVRAHTVTAARALRREDRLGSIRAGKLADLVVLDQDVLRLPADALADVAVSMTLLGGRVVHPR